MPAKILDVTELDFDSIKSSLIAYFRREDSPFKDWAFEGSGLSTLLDVLSYNTHYAAVLAHMAVNEAFLGSAQLRKNVVSRAKTLGYLPHSATAASTQIVLGGADIASLSEVPIGTVFVATVDGIDYQYTTTDSVSGDFSSPTTNPLPVTIRQGYFRNVRYQYDDTIINPKFRILDSNVDINQITVTSSTPNSSAVTNYTRFTELADISETTPVYFISENSNGLYQIEFGDNILGARPNNLDVINIKYLVTDGDAGNGADVFELQSVLTDSSGVDLPNITVLSVEEPSSGGGDRETIEQIRTNAPLAFQSQDRAVTTNDYRSIILNNSSADFVSVWGGEDAEPINLGTVYISAKTSGTPGYLSTTEKETLISVLENKGVLTITHEFLDPVFTYIYFDVFVKYDPNLTSLSDASLATKVRNAITAFSDANLQDYYSVFRHSNFLTALDNADPSILNTVVRVKAYKVFEPDLTTTDDEFVLDMGMKLDRDFTVYSASFVVSGRPSLFTTLEGSGFRTSNLNERDIYLLTESGARVSSLPVGYVNYETGVIVINKSAFLDNGFETTDEPSINIFVKPASDNIVAKRRNIVSIDTNRTTITATKDRIRLLGNSGAKGYQTIDRE